MTMDAAQGFALDVKGLSKISRAERQQAGSGLKPVAQQFEAMFLNMMLKSMRASVPDSSLYNSEAMKTMGQMRDMQLSQSLASRGIGIADMLQQQLAKGKHPVASGDDVLAALPHGTPRALTSFAASDTTGNERVAMGSLSSATRSMSTSPPSSSAREALASLWNDAREELAQRAPHIASFLDRVGDTAQRISAESGIPVRLIVAQAALETGWGRHDVRHEDGRAGHNLFGIKAVGAHAASSRPTVTTEYTQGVASQRQERFRAYESDEGAMRDYARMLTTHPRYEGVAGSTAHRGAELLQQRGYATDPRYAEKLQAIISQLPSALDRGVEHHTRSVAPAQYASLDSEPSHIF